ncbi:MAG TPA: PAS domain S-box protein [Chroococcidiopsis sp.]
MSHVVPPFRRLPRSGSLSLRVILILAFTGQIVGTVTLVGYLSFRNGQKAVSDLASQLRSELTARIKRELQGYFATPHEINRLNADAFARGDLDVINASRGESQLYQQMVVAPTVAFVYCGSQQAGEFFGVLRSPQDGSLQLSYGNQSNQFLRSYYSLNVAGDRTYFLRSADRVFDARKRPWYEKAVASERPIWTDVYIAFTTGLPNITAATPVYDRTGRRLLGVCATDVVLPEEFRAFLRNLSIGKNGQAFVVDRQGNLISDSTNEPLMIGEGEDAKSLPALNSKDPLVQGTAQYLVNQFGSFQSIKDSQRLEFQLDGQRQFLEVVPFQDRYGLDWLIVVVVPESDFMAQINANTDNTILLCLVTLGLAIAAAIFTSRRIAQPILRVTQASENIASGNLDQQVEASGILELEKLAGSFNSMTGQLKASFTTLETRNNSLRQSQMRNQALFDAIPDLIMEISAEGIYLDIVEAKTSTALLSNPRSRIVGQHVSDVLPDDAAQLYLGAIRQALATGETQTLKYGIRIRDRLKTYEARVVANGEAKALFIVRDITKAKLAEDALRESEATNRALIAAIPDLLIRVGRDGTYLTIAGQERFVIHDPDNFIPGLDVVHSLPPDLAQRRLDAIQQALQTDQMQMYEHQLLIDGVRRDEEIRVVKINDAQALIMVRDITERKQVEETLRITEENYRSIFENALEGIFQSTPDGHFIKVNPAMARIYGYDSPAELLEQVTQIATQIYVNANHREEFKRLMDEHGEVRAFEYQVRRKDNRIIWIEENTRAVRDSDGNIMYYEGLLEDITLRKQLEADLKRQVYELQIEIDQQKRQHEVAMITESGYFQELQEEIAQVDLDEFWR